MTPEKQRIAIAGACGWKFKGTNSHPVIGPKGDGRYEFEIPKYITDLNAMHEAEKTLDANQSWNFVNRLADVCNAWDNDPDSKVTYNYERLIRATAAQRAEAFLRTIGKWEDS